MPQIGERRSGATETVEWNGQRWMPVDETPAPAEAPQEGALSRFFGGAMSTSPLNPANIINAVSHPIDTLGHAVVDPLVNLFKAASNYKEFASQPGKGASWTPLVQAAEHLGGAVPLVGPAAINAGEKIGNGDIAGGAGELAGLASGALVPDVVEGAPRAMQKAGGAMERGGTALATRGGISVGGVHVPLSTIGLGEALLRRDPVGAAVAATPYALKYGGKGMRMAGEALEGLRNPAPEGETWDPAGPARAARAKAAQQAAREAASGDPLSTEPNAVYTGTPPKASPLQGVEGIARRANDMGAATLDSFQRAGYDVSPGGFRTAADLDRLKKGGGRNAAFEQFAMRPNTFEEDLSAADVPDFEYEAGEADKPGLSVGEMGSNPLPEVAPAGVTPQQAASLKALMALPSFRGLR